MEFFYEDCKSLLEQVNLQEKQLRHKRRWLLGLQSSRSEVVKVKGSKIQIERPIPEHLLREDDVSYETIKSSVEKLVGEDNVKNKHHMLQDDMQLVHSPKDVTGLWSQVDNMTNNALFQFAEALTGGTVRFERTRWKMKHIIKKCLETLSKQDITQQTSIIENHSSLFKNPHNFNWSNESRFIPDSGSYHTAVHKILDLLQELPTQTLSAMHRKLRCIKDYTPRLIPKKSGWGRDSLIKSLRKKCLNLLSKLSEGDALQEPLAKSMEVAGLALKLIKGHHYVTNFIQFSPETSVLQNEIATCIKLLDQRVKLAVLKDIKILLDRKAKLPDRNLRGSIRNLLTEYLFECSDMETIPQRLLKVLAVIKKRSQGPYKQLTEMKLDEEVECIFSVSASMKQVLWDLIPEHEFDLEFADAYMEDLEESDSDDICEDIELQKDNMENNMLCSNYSDEEVGSTTEIKQANFNSDENSAISSSKSLSPDLNFSGLSNSQCIHATRYHLVNLRNMEQMDTDSSKVTINQDSAEKNLMFDNQSMCKNQYLAVQAASDDTSMLAYRLIGHMLDDFAQIDGCELSSGDLSYLGSGNYDSKQKAREEPGTQEENSCSIIIKAAEELIPSFAKCDADKLRELIS